MTVILELDEGVKERLSDRAARHGRSLEAELHEILRDAAGLGPSRASKGSERS